ncbi:MAG: VWA domain-containing protein, partial [Planctomycetota bacterium]
MIRFVFPEAFLLGAVILLLLRRRFLVRNRTALVLRVLALLFALAVLARPYRPGSAEGRDLIFVVDRSRSMPTDAKARAEELFQQAVEERQRGDRIGVVTFGRDVVIESPPTGDYRPRPAEKLVDAEGTAIGRALETALALVPPGRPASIVLLSDGENTGPDAAPAARDALRRGVRIDAYPMRRGSGVDLAVDELALPYEVRAREPFRFSAWVRAEQAGTFPVRLYRDGELLAEGSRTLRRGLNRIVFRDVLTRPGVHRYEVEVRADGDRVSENNRARAVVRVAGPFRILCVTPGGRQDRLTRSLTAAGLAVVVTSPQNAPLDLDALDGFRAVVLENVAANDLPGGALQALGAYVRDLGGGLLMTGGRASYGLGGYHRTAVEEVLPVSMEIRQEQRKFMLAMAIVLDRSGSMGMNVGGRTKMDLANLGTCAAIDLLGPRDEVAVIAVDSSPHTIVPMGPAANRGAIQSQVRRIEAGGGGIFTYTALQAAARELSKSKIGNRHIVLFADASDAEEPGEYRTFVPDLVRAGVTVSVIGLGRATDPDGAFLKDVAKLGNGRAFFVQDATQLPRVFAQETIQVARSSLVEEPTSLKLRPELLSVGELLGGELPTAAGYSIAYIKRDAQIGALTLDEQSAPFVAFWQHGLGRSVAFLGEADGRLSGGFASWEGYGSFFATVVRWVAGNEASGDVFAELRREGHEAVLSVEVERGDEAKLEQLRAQVTGPRGKQVAVLLRRVGEQRLEARIPLASDGVYRAAVQVGDDAFLRVPPITLPYSPEFEPRRDPQAGERDMARLVRIAEGRMEPTREQLFAGSRTGRGGTDLSTWAAIVALLCFLAEIATRRLGWRLPRWKLPAGVSLPRPRRRAKPTKAAPPSDTDSVPGPEPEKEKPAPPPT